ncbi:MAG: DUF11 domain-containing protein [Deltaproteobacteria bacterium]|nr:DUF11 domain-containing protein [Deltaproteobacteria bacterium]
MRVKNLFAIILALLLFGLGGIFSPPADAATFTVNDPADAVDAIPGDGLCATASGLCSLRAAIMETNALPGPHTIMLPAGLYSLLLIGANEDNAASGDLDIRNNLIIRGDGAADTFINGNATDRVFQIIGTVGVELIGLTITNGLSDSGGGISNNGGTLSLTNSVVTSNSAAQGGGIFNGAGGTLITTGATFETNSASGNGGAVYNEASFQSRGDIFSTNSGINGGGIYNAAAGNLTINQGTFLVNFSLGTGTSGGGALFNNGLLTAETSTFIQNGTFNGGHGGALFQDSSQTAQLTNVTIGENTAEGNGGGIYVNAGELVLVNVTLNLNSAASGGGLFNNAGQASLLNTILADSTGDNCSGTITSQGNNLDSLDTCGFGAAGDIINTDPLLLGLNPNGGPTLTYALAAGSPAINAGNSALPTFTTDQRLYPRDATFDIGAYEFGAENNNVSADLTISKTTSLGTVAQGTLFSYIITVTNAGTPQSTQLSISDILPAGMTLNSIWTSQGTCTGTTTITCDLGDLSPTISATVILNVTASGAAIGLIANTATVIPGTEVPDPNAANNSSTVSTSIIFPLPVLTSINPASAEAGGPAFTLTLDGGGFVAGSVVRWNGAERPTTFVSNIQLTGAIAAADIAAVGTANVTVFNPLPGGGESNAVSFTIIANNPAPVIRLYLPLIFNGSPTSPQ